MKKKRLDQILQEYGIIKNKQEAFVLVTEGKVFVDGQKAISPAQMVSPERDVEVRHENNYVGRGAYKLEAALQKFDIDVRGKTIADIGSATGGFVEVLLRRGAKKVYAIDTARGKLALKLRRDPRVVVMEKTDVRALQELPERADFVTIDVSLIPLEEILPHTRRFLKKGGEVVALFKPQYQTRDLSLLKKGIVKDERSRENLLAEFRMWAREHNWDIMGEIRSPIQGAQGNSEYLLWLH